MRRITLGHTRDIKVNKIKLTELQATNYGSLRDETIIFEDFNVFIGANASGKSTILDALRFMQDGLRSRDFRRPVGERGGARYLFGKWDPKARADLRLTFCDVDTKDHFVWSVGLTIVDRRFSITEKATMRKPDGQQSELLKVTSGKGWWLSENGQKVQIEEEATACALSAASADAAFMARNVSQFVSQWSFVEPNPSPLRRRRRPEESDRLEIYGGNLAERLHRLKETSPQTFQLIASATKSVLGIPEEIKPVVDREDHFHVHFVEKGLIRPVSQSSASTGTLRILTLMTALFENRTCGVVAIEEPENNIHPTALSDFVQYLNRASESVQVLITTHSPSLLNFVEDPHSVCVVRRDEQLGTKVTRERNPENVIEALEASGFRLGEFHETMGFGR